MIPLISLSQTLWICSNSNSFKVCKKNVSFEVYELRFDLDINPIHHPSSWLIKQGRHIKNIFEGESIYRYGNSRVLSSVIQWWERKQTLPYFCKLFIIKVNYHRHLICLLYFQWFSLNSTYDCCKQNDKLR